MPAPRIRIVGEDIVVVVFSCFRWMRILWVGRLAASERYWSVFICRGS